MFQVFLDIDQGRCFACTQASLTAMLDELLGGLLDRIFTFLSTPAETLLASESALAAINGVDDLRGELASPVEPESIESSAVGSPDTLSEPDIPSGRTYADIQMNELRKAYLNLLQAILAAELGDLFLSPSTSAPPLLPPRAFVCACRVSC